MNELEVTIKLSKKLCHMCEWDAEDMVGAFQDHWISMFPSDCSERKTVPSNKRQKIQPRDEAAI